jgi:predicted alpha/beta-hydrolase family hydrolase
MPARTKRDTPEAERLRVPTAKGDAEVVLEGRSRGAPGLLVLGHGASGGIDAVDLVHVRDAALGLGLVVARVLQPYRVQPGRRPPPAPAVLDEAWAACVTAARTWAGPASAGRSAAAGPRPFVLGGRSMGARVAARTARGLGAAGVVALAFPLHPPGRADKSRADELDPAMPTLVVNGDRDPFGVPTSVGQVRVVVRPGEGHDLRRDPTGVADVVAQWLKELLGLG